MRAELPVIEDGHKDIAVALRYDGGRDTAPLVTAKGRGRVADRILALARAHGIEVREDADLVQVLEKLEIGSAIPPLAFAAVAEILACLYRRNAELAAGHHAGAETGSHGLPSDRTMPR